MKEKRILQIIDSMGVGGAETMLMNVYREINKNNIQFDFFLSGEKEGFYESEIKKLGGKIYRTQKKSKHPIKYAKNLKNLLRINKYDTVHIHDSSSKNFFSLIIANSNNVKKRIYHSHSSQGKKRIIHKIFRRYVNKLSTHKVACSDLAANWMFEKRATEAQIIYNPIDVIKFKFNQRDRESVRNSLNLNDKIVFVHVGRFSKTKNHEFLINIFDEITKIKTDTVLLLIGEGPEKNKIIEMARHLKLTQNIMFLGIFDDVSKYLSASDLFIMPSLYEGLPVTIVETQANGLPSLLSDTITKDVRKTNLITYLSLNDNAENWALKALEIIKQGDLNKREFYNAKAKEIFDVKIIIKQLEEIYLSK